MLRNFFLLYFFLFLSLQIIASKTDWAVQLSTTDRVTVKDMAIDANGNTYTVGVFYDSLFVNSYAGKDTLIDTRFGETFIVKMDSCGNLIWAKQFVGNSTTDPYSIEINSIGQLIIAGSFSGSTDFDPSSNSFVVSPAGGNALYIVVLDNDGNLINVGRLGGSPGLYFPKISIDNADNIYVTGAFSGGAGNAPVDLDPSLAKTLLVTPHGFDGFIIKINTQMDLDWLYHIRAPGSQILATDISTKNDVVSASFRFSREVRFDNGNGVQILQASSFLNNGLIINLDSNKQFLGYAHIPCTRDAFPSSLNHSGNSDMYVTGFFKDSLLLQINGSPTVLKSQGGYDSFVGKWNNNGDLIWVNHLSNPNDLYVYSSQVTKNNELYISGRFQDTIDFGGNLPLLISTGKTNFFMALLAPNGSVISAEQLDIKSSKNNQVILDKKDNVYASSSFETAFLKKYDGDTSFTVTRNENALLFRLSNEANRINLGVDKLICDSDSVTLSPNLIPGDKVFWSTGETSPSLTVKQPGTYHVKVENCGRVFRDTIEIQTIPFPFIDLGPDTTLCETDTFLIQSSSVNVKDFFWNTGDTTQNLLAKFSGKYILRAENSPACFVTDTINVNYIKQPEVFTYYEKVLCGETQFTLDAGNVGSTYLWSTGESSQEITVFENGIYSVEVDNSYCTTIDSVKITFLQDECLPSIQVPNVFTPNGDGINDLFIIESKNLQKVETLIYNRWGELVFQDAGTKAFWDGRTRGIKQAAGTYFLVINYEYMEWERTELIKKSIKESIELIR